MTDRLSQPVSTIAPHYTAVVVGSGYGAGVAASRLARAGQRVAVLERGREIRPGHYPNDLASASADVQANGENGPLGPADGLYQVHLNPDMLAVVGCGLGGTSLINANVALEFDPRIVNTGPWPQVFRENPALLAPYAERARRMLDAKPYPEHYPRLNKLAALQASAKEMRQPFMRPPIAVNFEDQTNPFGVPQPRCNNCGDCTSGCNVGAKNTTLMNYLPDAKNHGAQIFTGARVSHVAREGSRWRVFFQAVALRGEAARADAGNDEADAAARGDPGLDPDKLHSITADIVVLGAGSLGSSEILLRSREKGLPLSDRLGTRFSGNGDVLAWGYDNAWKVETDSGGEETWAPIYGVGAGDNKLEPQQMPGPCITGVIDMRGQADVTRGLVIEEGVVPGAVATMMAPAMFFADALAGSDLRYGATQGKKRLLDAQQLGNAVQNDPGSLTAQAYCGPVARTQTYLIMSVDDSGGTLRLIDDRLRIDWPGCGSSLTMQRDRDWLEKANDAIQGIFVANPITQPAMGNKIVTVHPLGGCGMADDASLGVVDADCRVFAGASGSAVHDGLFVCDGAAVPGAVGVNPLLTISAVAERALERLCAARGWTIDQTMQAPSPLPPRHEAEEPGFFSRALHAIEDGAIGLAKKAISELIEHQPERLSPSFQFTERMHGWVSLDALPTDDPNGAANNAGGRMADPYAVAAAWGRTNAGAGGPLDFELTIRTEDLQQMVSDPTHPAQISGVVRCKALSEQPMPVQSGVFHLLPVDADRVETWTMTYEMVLLRQSATGAAGAAPGRLRFLGHKVLHQRDGSSPWGDTTTLFVRIHDADAPTQPCIAMGQLTLNLEDLLRQAMTIQLDPPHNLLGELEEKFPAAKNAISKAYLGKFAGLFGGTLFRAYGGLLADLSNFPAQDLATLPTRVLRAPRPETQVIDTAGGFSIRLTRYRGGKKGPVLLAPGFSVRASSFAADTVGTNLVEALCDAQYDVWLFDYRASADSESPIGPECRYTIDDIATVDWPAAVNAVRAATGAKSVQAIAHCVGSMSLLMALLRGMEGVRSLVSSQLTLHPVTSWLNAAKADLNVVRVMEAYAPLHGRFNSVPGTTDLDHQIDVMAYSVPVPEGEACKNPLCRRVFAIFGPSYTHAQLNHATHTALARWFGEVSLSPFEQLSLIMQDGRVVDAEGNDSYLRPELAKRLALPISFVAGARNQIFYPETCIRTHAWLASQNDPALYTRRIFDGYAHMDLFVGRDAARDVFPYLIEQLER